MRTKSYTPVRDVLVCLLVAISGFASEPYALDGTLAPDKKEILLGAHKRHFAARNRPNLE